MYRVMIVDDEELDREGLRSQIKWEDFDLEVTFAATNGYEALKMINSDFPDILITDVKMPGMDGLKLVDSAIKINPNIKTLFVSGHDDFEFMKKAIKLNAFEYILKPVNTSELIEAVGTIVRAIRKEELERADKQSLLKFVGENKRLITKSFFNDLLYGTLDQIKMENAFKWIGNDLKEKSFTTLMVEIDDYDTLDNSLLANIIGDKGINLEQALLSLASGEAGIEVLQQRPSRYVMLVIFDKSLNEDICAKKSNELAHYIVEKISAEFGVSFTVTLGMMVKEMEKISRSYNRNCEYIAQKMFVGKGRVIDTIPSFDVKMKNEKVMLEIDQGLVKCVRNMDPDKMNHLINYLFENVRAKNLADSVYLRDICINIISRLQMTLFEMNETVEDIFGQGVSLVNKLLKFETIVDIEQWLKNVFMAVINHMEQKTESGVRKVIELVKDYVEENYSSEISLKEVATLFYYSPNHLGFLFKKETGKNFNEYLTEYRMKKTAEFLKDPTIRIYEVAERVSYKNLFAFSSQFEKHIGMTPKEYRERP